MGGLKTWLCTLVLCLQLGCAHTAATGEGVEPAVKEAMDALPGGKTPAELADWVLEMSEAAQGSGHLGELKSRQQRGTLELLGQGILIQTLTIWEGMDKIYLRQEVPNVGTMEQAFANGQGWARDPFMGLRDLSKSELSTLAQSTLAGEADYRPFFPVRTLDGTLMENERVIYRVVLTPPEGEPLTLDIDARSFLPIRMEQRTEGPLGKMKMTVFLDDWREMGEQLIPYEQLILAGPVKSRARLLDSQDNVAVDATIFLRPTE